MSKRTCNRKLYPYLNALMFISNIKRPLVLESWLKRKEIRWNSEETRDGSNEKMKNMHREVVFVTDQRRGEAISLTVRARRDRLSNRHLSHRSSWKRSSLAEPRASRGTHRANPASGPKPHKPYPQGPLKIRACVLEPNPDPKQVHTGLARGQVLLLPSLLIANN